MTRDRIRRHEKGIQRLDAAFGGGVSAASMLTPEKSSKIKGMLLGLGLRRGDEVAVADPKTLEVALPPARRTRAK